MLTESTLTSSKAMMTSAFGGPRADVMLTSAGHVALPGAATCQSVCFSFSENLYLIPEIILSFRKS
jgi:hypothetical protein